MARPVLISLHMSLHILNAQRLWRVATRPVLCTAWLLCGGCMFWSSPVTERVTPIPASEPKYTLGRTNISAVAPQGDVSTHMIEMQHRIEELSELLALSCAQQNELQHKEGQLQAVEKKAVWSDALAQELNTLTTKTDALKSELAESKKTITDLNNRMAFLHARTNELEQTLSELTGKMGPLEDTMRTLRMGNFEYYTVHPGDSCKSIAALPYIYSDESKQSMIRQANRGQVADLDNLTPGEVLIIPRPKGEAVHEL